MARLKRRHGGSDPAQKHLLDSYGTPWTYCTPAKIMQKVFENCGAKPLVDLGFGDDSEMGGYGAGYDRWADQLWAAMAEAGGEAPVAAVEEVAAGPGNDPVEYIKLGSAALKQPLLNDLMDATNDKNVQAASA